MRLFIQDFADTDGFGVLKEFIDAVPTAELEPITETYTQSDEVDMGMTYEELSVFGRLRKVEHLGPIDMFKYLVDEWGHSHSPAEVKIKKVIFLGWCQSQEVFLLLWNQ